MTAMGNTLVKPVGPHVPSWAFVCITGQLARLELDSKVKLIKPLLKHVDKMVVGLVMTGGKPNYVNPSQIRGIRDKERDEVEMYDFSSAKTYLESYGVDVVTGTPKDGSAYGTNTPYQLKLSDKHIGGKRGEEYRKNRARMHIKQFLALQMCGELMNEEIDKRDKKPRFVMRIRDDTMIVNLHIRRLLRTMKANRLAVITQHCATWGGINDKLAFVAPAAAEMYFKAPMFFQSDPITTKQSLGAETYYDHVYGHRAKLDMVEAPVEDFASVVGRFQQHRGCWKFVPNEFGSDCELDVGRGLADRLKCFAVISPSIPN